MVPAPRTMNPRRNLMRRSAKYDVSGAALQAPKLVKRHVFKGAIGSLGPPTIARLQPTFAPLPLDIERFRTLFARKLREHADLIVEVHLICSLSL